MLLPREFRRIEMSVFIIIIVLGLITIPSRRNKTEKRSYWDNFRITKIEISPTSEKLVKDPVL
jgi:hypothetical protein